MMSCILPKYIDEILDTQQFEATMQQYGVTFEMLTENHPFITEYLQPHLQKIADDIAEQSGRTKDSQKVKVSIKFADPAQSGTRSWHNHETNEVLIDWDKDNGTIADKCRNLVNDLRHESEHANQSDGDGYSIDQRILSQLSRIVYPREGPLYHNNFNELRAKLAEFQMHKARYDQLVQNNTPFEQRREAANHLWDTRNHLLKQFNAQAQEAWMQGAQRNIKRMLRNTKLIRDVFPDAKNTWQAKQMAIEFLQQRAPVLFKELQDIISFYRDFASQAQEDITKEWTTIQAANAQKSAIEKANELQIPILSEMPQPQPYYRLRLNDESCVEKAFSEHNIALYNRALVHTNGEMWLVGDNVKRDRDYMHPKSIEESEPSKDESNDEINIDDLPLDEDKFEPQANEEERWDDDEIFDD